MRKRPRLQPVRPADCRSEAGWPGRPEAEVEPAAAGGSVVGPGIVSTHDCTHKQGSPTSHSASLLL